MVTFTSHSVAETLGLGAAWGQAARAGWVIGLVGELGAGKTQLVKGVAQGLGVSERVHSPTFTLVNEYRSGRLPLFHLDFYRLDTWAQFESAGLETYLFEPRGVTIIEWFDRCQAWIADGLLAPPTRPFRHVVIESLEEGNASLAQATVQAAGPSGKSAVRGWPVESGRMIRYEDIGT